MRSSPVTHSPLTILLIKLLLDRHWLQLESQNFHERFFCTIRESLVPEEYHSYPNVTQGKGKVKVNEESWTS